MGGRAALMIIPDSSFVCFIFHLCQHCEAGQRDLPQHRLSAKYTKVFLLSLVFLIFIFLVFLGGGISGLYDLVNKLCLKQKRKKSRK